MIKTIYTTEIEPGILLIKILNGTILEKELVTPVGSDSANYIIKLIENYMEKGEEYYELDASPDYKTLIHRLKD